MQITNFSLIILLYARGIQPGIDTNLLNLVSWENQEKHSSCSG